MPINLQPIDRQRFTQLVTRLAMASEMYHLAKDELRAFMVGFDQYEGYGDNLVATTDDDLKFMLLNAPEPSIFFAMIADEMESRGMDVQEVLGRRTIIGRELKKGVE